MEFIAEGKKKEALEILRSKLNGLCKSKAMIHKLTSYIICSGEENLKNVSGWEGKFESRRKLISDIQVESNPEEMIPSNILEVITSFPFIYTFPLETNKIIPFLLNI